MNWEAVGAIGEILGATAVVVSLIYLAAQIRQNNSQVAEQVRALKLQAYDASATHFSGFRLAIARSPQLASLWQRAKKSFMDLEPDEQAQVNELLIELFYSYENMLQRKHQGVIDDDLWEVVEQNIDAWVSNSGIREWWERGPKQPHSEEFNATVNRICAKRDAAV
jgi:hypothetical protein